MANKSTYDLKRILSFFFFTRITINKHLKKKITKHIM